MTNTPHTDMRVVDWHELLLGSPDWLEKLDRQAYRRFQNNVLAEEATAYVIEELFRDNRKLLKNYSGKANPLTYVYSVASNLLEEFSRKKFGRIRPPEWLKRNGNLWLTVYKLILERHSNEEIIHQFNDSPEKSALVQQIVRTIKSKIPSLDTRNSAVSFEEYTEASGEIIPSLESEDVLSKFEHDEYEATIYILSLLLSEKNNKLKQLFKIRQHLNEEELLLMRLAFVEGFKTTQAAQALAMPAYQVRRSINKALNKLANLFSSLSNDHDTPDLKCLLIEADVNL